MVSSIPLETSVTEILDKALAAGEQIPSLRAIRAKTGRGSLTTIANVVREWRANHIAPEPEPGLTSDQIKSLWSALEPIIAEKTEGIRKHFTEKIEILEDKIAALQEENELLKEAKIQAEYVAQEATADLGAAEMRADERDKKFEATLAAKQELEIRIAMLTTQLKAEEAKARKAEEAIATKRELEIQVATLKGQIEILKEAQKPARPRVKTQNS